MTFWMHGVAPKLELVTPHLQQLPAQNVLQRVKSPNLDRQSHYREVPRWEIFMEQELRFGLDLGQLAVLKKKGLGQL